MVLLPIKSQFTSLIITVVSFLCEFAVLYAFRIINGLYDCRILKREEKLPLRNHITRSTIIAFIAFLLFFTLEIVASLLGNPADVFKVENHNCISTGNFMKRKRSSLYFPIADDIFVACLKKHDFIDQYAGNYSNQTGLIQCDKQPMYSFRNAGVRNMTVRGATVGCTETNDGPLCTFAIQKGNVTYLSEAFVLQDRRFIKELEFYETMVHFEEKLNLKRLAERNAEGIARGFNNPAQLRRNVFTGAEKRKCDFKVRVGDGTTLPISLLCVLVTVWISSLVLFAVSLVFRRKVFFKMSNPRDWATKTMIKSNEYFLDDKNQLCSTVRESDGEVEVCMLPH